MSSEIKTPKIYPDPLGKLEFWDLKQDTWVIAAANYFACRKHCEAKKFRKNEDGFPYIVHPLHAQMILVERDIKDVEILAAAALHDTLEDTKTTVSELMLHFGSKITSYVIAVTDNKNLSKIERKKHQIIHVADPNFPVGAAFVKLADKLSNLSELDTNPPKNWSPEIIKGYTAWSYEVLISIANNKSIISKLKNDTKNILPFARLCGDCMELCHKIYGSKDLIDNSKSIVNSYYELIRD